MFPCCCLHCRSEPLCKAVSDFCGNKIGYVRHTTPHRAVACRDVFTDWHSQQCVRALLFYLHRVQQISTFSQQRSFFPRRSAFSLPPCAHKENNSGTSRAEVSSPFQSGVISLFTFQEISILHPGCVYFPWFSLQFDITQRPCHIPLMLFFKSSASISFIPFVPQIHFVSVYPLCAAPLNYSHHIFRLFKLSYEQPEQPVQRFYKFCFFPHANP